eukprot:CAMPEP_0184295338 /NCGR_PEP_ID=MMETSP1049-20130417/6210_1 /TAXON_ID=77928 /ORGANISM="Proteomonas sulcata, Strain CCMP704" /LENGTH=236 /DNA_ID=CAMNT_0026603813 /DNA_START=1 /DNA_END=711 /DNA_ORIENTATION=-
MLAHYRRLLAAGEVEENDPSIMGHLLRTGYPSDAEREADMLLFLVAGSDTSAHTIAHTIYGVATNPEICRKVQAELDQINPERREWTQNLVLELSYTLLVIKESMRLWPVAGDGVVREAAADLQVGECLIPQGATCHIVLFPAFRSTRLEDPDSFRPERFQDGSPEKDWLEEHVLPFASGPRKCLGMNLAQTQIRIIPATLLQRFSFQKVGAEDPPLELGLTLFRKNFKVIPRSRV